MNNWRLGALVVGLVVGLGLTIGAVLADDPPSDDVEAGEAAGTTTLGELDPPASSTASGENGASDTRAPSLNPGDCDFTPGRAFTNGPTNTMTAIGEVDDLRVEGAVYPRPDYEGNPWSQWGQGVALDDGRFLSAIGDHLGPDGNSYLYEYDPSSGSLTMIGDVLSYAEHQPGSWGYGKVHGQMALGSCGEVYVATYWGTRRDLRFDDSYSGDLLFRIDPEGRTISSLGVPIEERGLPSLAGSVNGRLIYGEALDPGAESDFDAGPFFVYDTLAEEVIFAGPDAPHGGYRNILVDGKGRAYYSTAPEELTVYDPETNETTVHGSPIPGGWMRASTRPTADGRVFGVTNDERAFFVLEPSGEIESLGTAPEYTTSMAVHPDGDRFFYIPDAHGGAWENGSPLISVDTTTGEQTVMAELNTMVEDGLGLRLGGTYNVAVHPSGDRIYIGMNAGPLGAEDGFGDIVLLVVHLT